MSVMILMTSMERISSPLIAIGKAQIAATAFFAVIDAPPPRTGSLRAPEVAATGDIVFRDVSFTYPGRPSDLVLDGLTLTLEGGKTTAIVGPSGAGKSTIVGLLVRWYGLRDQGAIARVKPKPKPAKGDTAPKKEDDEEGEETAPREKTSQPPVQLRGSISTGGCELDDINLPWWRSQIGLVQQEPFLFNDTIFNNVAHGLVGTDFEHEGEGKNASSSLRPVERRLLTSLSIAFPMGTIRSWESRGRSCLVCPCSSFPVIAEAHSTSGRE